MSAQQHDRPPLGPLQFIVDAFLSAPLHFALRGCMALAFVQISTLLGAPNQVRYVLAMAFLAMFVADHQLNSTGLRGAIAVPALFMAIIGAMVALIPA